VVCGEFDRFDGFTVLARPRFCGDGARFTLTVVRGELDRFDGFTELARLRL
jgi:hypothetical protein